MTTSPQPSSTMSSTAAPTPSVVVPTGQPDHGSWLLVLIVGGFVLAGLLTLALAHYRTRRSPE